MTNQDKSATPPKLFNFGPNDMDPESTHIFRWHVFVPDGVKFEELLKPEAWQHVAYKLRPMARISVTSDSSRFIGELVVISCGQLWATVKEVFYKEFDVEPAMDVNDEYEAAWISNRYKFGIRRKSDNQWILKDLPDQAAANVALAAQVSEMRKAG